MTRFASYLAVLIVGWLLAVLVHGVYPVGALVWFIIVTVLAVLIAALFIREAERKQGGPAPGA
jgi:cobalamin synthase